MPIRPVVNNIMAPTYKLGTFALEILKHGRELRNENLNNAI
jgi:hypothetical protein